MKLSKNDYIKTEFKTSIQLSKKEVQLVAEYYNNKHNIDIRCITHNYKDEAHDIGYKDLLSIQQELNDNMYVGYIWDNTKSCLENIVAYKENGAQELDIKTHEEAFIVTREFIIKPLIWQISEESHVLDITKLKNKKVATTNLSDFTRLNGFDDSHNYIINPQAGIYECGSLCFAYLKNYLKNNGEQVKKYTLIIPYYKNEILKYFFFPSPHVLRYSQSSLYNKLVLTMINPDLSQKFIKSGLYEVYIYSIQEILVSTLDSATRKNHQDICNITSNILKEFKVFKESWLEIYYEVEKKRQKMYKEPYNRYLEYTTHRFHNIAIQQNLKLEWWYEYAENEKFEELCKYYEENYTKVKFSLESSLHLFLKCQKEKNDNIYLDNLKKLIFDEITSSVSNFQNFYYALIEHGLKSFDDIISYYCFKLINHFNTQLEVYNKPDNDYITLQILITLGMKIDQIINVMSNFSDKQEILEYMINNIMKIYLFTRQTNSKDITVNALQTLINNCEKKINLIFINATLKTDEINVFDRIIYVFFNNLQEAKENIKNLNLNEIYTTIVANNNLNEIPELIAFYLSAFEKEEQERLFKAWLDLIDNNLPDLKERFRNYILTDHAKKYINLTTHLDLVSKYEWLKQINENKQKKIKFSFFATNYQESYASSVEYNNIK